MLSVFNHISLGGDFIDANGDRGRAHETDLDWRNAFRRTPGAKNRVMAHERVV